MHRELTNKWKPIDIKYSKMKMIILFFIPLLSIVLRVSE